MLSLSFLCIMAIFGILIVIAAAIVLTSPALPAAAQKSGTPGVQYGRDTPLPEPYYFPGIDFDTQWSNDHLTVIPLKGCRQRVTSYSAGPFVAMTVLSWYGMVPENSDETDMWIVREMNTSPATGTNPSRLAGWLSGQGPNATGGTRRSGAVPRKNLKKTGYPLS